MLQVTQACNREVEFTWAWTLGAGSGVSWRRRSRHGLVHGRHDLTWCAKLRRAKTVMAHLGWVHHHLGWRVLLVMLGHGWVLDVRVGVVRI